jgi:DNA-binding winged helix-turn-helix (wHTH) protein/TolB-like protein/Tfp pilus assembly protein PilF
MSGVGGGFAFGPFVLDEQRGLLLRDGEPVPLTPRAHQTLLFFVRHPGRLVGKEELFAALWPGLHVEDNNLTQQISALRRALGDGCIETVPRRGYRFVVPVTIRPGSANGGPAGASPVASADDVAVAVPPMAIPSARDAGPTGASADSRALWLLSGALLALAVVVAVGLRWRTETPPPLARIHSVAVLPFTPLSPRDAFEEGVGFGLADAVITRLGSIHAISVRPTSAVARYEALADPASVGRVLRVDAVLQTTFRRHGEQVRIRTQLVDVRDEVTVWTAQFDLTTRELPQLEDTIAESLAQRLGAELVAARGEPAAPPRLVDSRAYVAYLQGRWLWGRRTGRDFLAARRAFEAALAREPSYAPAHAGLADALLSQSLYDEQARAAARRALALDASLAEPHATLGFLAWFHDHRAAVAQAELARAVELNPSYATAHQWLAFVHLAHRRCPAARRAIALAAELDPTSLSVGTDVAHVDYYCGDYAAAEREVRAVLALDPHFAQAHNVLGQVLVERGRYGEARAELDAASVLLGASPQAVELLAREGNRAAAGERLAAMVTDRAHPYYLARAEAWLGRLDEAVLLLERATRTRNSDVMLLAVDPAAAPLRTDGRVQALLRRLGLEAAAPSSS